jgi:3-dehydroquinate synthase
MEDSRVDKSLDVKSYKGVYEVYSAKSVDEIANIYDSANYFFIIDANIAKIYGKQFHKLITSKNAIVIEATEKNKSIEQVLPIISKLIECKIRRSHTLVGIGGGIIQDITCFIASTLLRGLDWNLIPTTLLAQADSCIGSKSSINMASVKNILGTFNPPNKVYICLDFIKTLETKDIFSGVGEMLKVHAIDSKNSFEKIKCDYDQLFVNDSVMHRYIFASLEIKKRFIEKDEFDKGVRNIFNYGHSFGHAIESATNFEIPHGVAVTIGMDIANWVAKERGFIKEENYIRMKSVLKKNMRLFENSIIPFEPFFNALLKDKKNTVANLVLIMPMGDSCDIQKVEIAPDNTFIKQCTTYFEI